jgi:hypothetical protein
MLAMTLSPCLVGLSNVALSDIQRKQISPGVDPMKKIARIVTQWLPCGKASLLPEARLPCQISGAGV